MIDSARGRVEEGPRAIEDVLAKGVKGIERTAYPTAKDHGLKLRLQDGASENTSIGWHCSENARNPLKECESERLKGTCKKKAGQADQTLHGGDENGNGRWVGEGGGSERDGGDVLREGLLRARAEPRN